MLQVILVEPGRVELRDVPTPEPSEGEVLVKIDTALTCGTDLKAYIRGHRLIPMPGPFGHEYSGTVAATGKGVEGFKEGDPIMGVHSAPCMECRYCRRGFYNLCEVMMDRKILGAFSEYLLLPPHVVKQNLFHKPENISFKEAALLEPFSCVLHPYGNIKLDKMEKALVIGAGSIGLMHGAYLKNKGLRVIVTDISEERLSTALEIGAEKVLLAKDTEGVVKEATQDLDIDLVVECTGQPKVWEEAPNYTRRGGTVILFGGCPVGSRVSYDTHRLHYDELTLLGSFHYTPQDVRSAYEILTGGDVDLSLVISGESPMRDIEHVLTLLKEGKGIKYALKP